MRHPCQAAYVRRFVQIILCILNLFFEPITIWTNMNTAMGLCMVIGFVPIAMFVSIVALFRRLPVTDNIQHRKRI